MHQLRTIEMHRLTVEEFKEIKDERVQAFFHTLRTVK